MMVVRKRINKVTLHVSLFFIQLSKCMVNFCKGVIDNED